MDKIELEKRTKAFAIKIILFIASLPKNKITDVMGFQLLKAGTSIGANYREANRAVSKKEFISKISIVEKEASETQYWLEIFDAVKLELQKTRIKLTLDTNQLNDLLWLLRKSSELLAIFTSIGKTSKSRNPKS